MPMGVVMSKVLLVLLFLSPFALARDPKVKPNPVTVVDRYSVVFPESTASKNLVLAFDAGTTRVDYCTQRAEFDGVEYMTTYTAFVDSTSAAAYAKVKPDVFLKGARDAMKGKDGAVTFDKTFIVDDTSGQSLTIEAGKNVIRAKLFYKDQTLYQVLVVGPKDKVSGPEATKFLESFKLDR